MSRNRKYYGKFRNFNFGDFSHCIEIQKRAEFQNNTQEGEPKIDFETIETAMAFWEDLKPIEVVGDAGGSAGVVAKNVKNAFIVIPYRDATIFSSDTWILSLGVRYKVDNIDDTDKKKRYLKMYVCETGDENLIGAKT